jgi:hypothetical protein
MPFHKDSGRDDESPGNLRRRHLNHSNDGAEIERLTDLPEAKFQTLTIQEGADISFVGMEIRTKPNGDIKIR